MLSSTLNLIALTRQTALAKGQEAIAEKVAPVESKLRELVYESRQTSQTKPATGMMAQSDFQRLLAVKNADAAASNETASSADRNQIVSAMAAGGMTDLDIARHMGISREEVQVIISLGRRHSK
jgi:DNA-binding NarL/FixJ family response regulator